IRDRNVTGVQTCALPIFLRSEEWSSMSVKRRNNIAGTRHSQRTRKQRYRKIWAALTAFALALPVVASIAAPTVASAAPNPDIIEIGRASCREREKIAVTG